MGVERRRQGFRLPWTADGDSTGEAQAAVADGDEVPARAEAETPDSSEATMSDMNAEGAAPEPGSADEPMPPTVPEGDPQAGTTDAEADDFLKSLVGAMRGVAESSRDTSLAELRTTIEARIQALTAEAAEGETDIRRKADTDLEAVGEWERTEVDRVRGEAETKRNDRRTALERELTDHRNASERAVEAARARLSQHESELAAFFSQLGEITDPAAFVAAAKRMPRAPELESATTAPMAADAPPASDAPPADADPRLAALGVTTDSPSADAPESTEDESTATEATASETAAAAEPVAEPMVTETAPATDEMAATNGTTPAEDAHLAARLAQLDQRLSGAPQATSTPTAPVAPAGAETSTAIVVKGLGSFGAITSFKQSLERVEGIRGVTLSLGPTGEFVYRASHAGEFDLAAAIQALEGPAASIENSDGTLVVTLSRAR